MKDDWRGEHLIRAKPSMEDRAQENRRIVSVTWHKKRRKAGFATPAAAAHSRFAKTVYYDLHKGDA